MDCAALDVQISRQQDREGILKSDSEKGPKIAHIYQREREASSACDQAEGASPDSIRSSLPNQQ